ncbi:hypothetical protein [Agrococcus citreus]|uniref:Abi family protein n=1 Tax=Agrococcus citreus TaxID=84643 RepID=A0ABP4JHT8_9MICO
MDGDFAVKDILTGVLGQLSPQASASLAGSLARDRFRAYVRPFGGDQAAGSRLYVLDVELAGALLELVHFAEVLLRERIHRELTSVDGPQWYNDPRHVLDYRTRGAIAKASNRLPTRFSPGQMVAELNFGTWAGLFEQGGQIKHRDGSFVRQADYDADLWAPALHSVFDREWPSVTRIDAEGLLRRVRNGRNRISHHESLVFGIHQHGERTPGGKFRRQPIGSFLSDVRRLIQVLDSSMGKWLDTCDHAEELLRDSLALRADQYAQGHLRNREWI